MITADNAGASPSPHDEGVGRGVADLLVSKCLFRTLPELRRIRRHVAMIFQLPLDLRTTGSPVKRTPNRQKDPLPVTSPLMIPKPQLFDAFFQELCSRFIPAPLIRKTVHKTIQFDGQSCGGTIKIEKVRCERMLSPKLKTSKSSRAQGAPKLFFLRSLLAAETPGVSGGIHNSNSSQIDARNKKPLCLALSPLLRRGEREYRVRAIVLSSSSTRPIDVT